MKSSGAPMSVRLVLAVAGAALIGGLAPMAAHASVDSTETIRAGNAQVQHADDHANTVDFAVVLPDRHTMTGVGVAPVPKSDTGQPSAAAIGIGTGRFVPTAAAVLGLFGVVLGGLALSRSAGRLGIGNRRRRAVVALVAGLVGVIVGGLHLVNSAGGFGTGNGRAGAIVAMAVGLIAVVLGGLALARSRATRV